MIGAECKAANDLSAEIHWYKVEQGDPSGPIAVKEVQMSLLGEQDGLVRLVTSQARTVICSP